MNAISVKIPDAVVMQLALKGGAIKSVIHMGSMYALGHKPDWRAAAYVLAGYTIPEAIYYKSLEYPGVTPPSQEEIAHMTPERKEAAKKAWLTKLQQQEPTGVQDAGRRHAADIAAQVAIAAITKENIMHTAIAAAASTSIGKAIDKKMF